MINPIKILNKRSATKAELREALAEALFEPLPQWAEVDDSLTANCRNYFSQEYRKATGFDYRYQPKDYKALSMLLGNIADATTAKNPQATNGDVYNAFTYFIDHLPEWYRNGGFSLCIINGKFNEIIASMRHERTNRAGVSEDYARGVLRDLRG